jgi:hypothetical protein
MGLRKPIIQKKTRQFSQMAALQKFPVAPEIGGTGVSPVL